MLIQRQRGFTLVELAIILLIIGVLAMLGAPAFSRWLANARVRVVAESLQNDLRLAQAEAVRRNRQVAVILTDNDPAASTLAAATSARNWSLRALPLLNSTEGVNSTAGTTTFIRGNAQTTSSDVQIRSDASAICYNSVGRLAASTESIADASDATCTQPASATPGYFRVQNTVGDRPLWVEVHLGGKVRMCDPNRLLPDQPEGCCPQRCCALSQADFCVY